MTAVVINGDALKAIDRDLEKIAFIHRSPVLKRGMRAAAKVVSRRTRGKLPAPGYPGDKAGKSALRDTLGEKVIHWDNTGSVTSISGYRYERGGQHGHLAEEGHVMRPHKSTPQRRTPNVQRAQPYKGNKVGMGARVEGRHDLQTSAEETLPAQYAAVERALKLALKRQGA